MKYTRKTAWLLSQLVTKKDTQKIALFVPASVCDQFRISNKSCSHHSAPLRLFNRSANIGNLLYLSRYFSLTFFIYFFVWRIQLYKLNQRILFGITTAILHTSFGGGDVKQLLASPNGAIFVASTKSCHHLCLINSSTLLKPIARD